MSKSKWKLFTLFCLILSAMLTMAGCEADDDDDDSDTLPATNDTDSTPTDTGSGNTSTDPVSTDSQVSMPLANCDAVKKVCVVSGTIVENQHWTAGYSYLLRGGVFVGDDINETVLTIDAGVTVYGVVSTQGMLVITRGSKIVAEGTAAAPIVFTSSNVPGTRARGDWGGLIINGRATVNGCDTPPCEASGEGGTGWYGGNNDLDSSGVLKYVRVEFAGRLISEDNELNGIAFQGVGSGTTIDYVQVHMNADDGIEFFGGTANWKHIYLTGIGDDNLDWTDGWRGKGQFLVAKQYPDAGDQGIEADNNAENNTLTPISYPTLSNITLVGSGGDNSDIGMLLREGTKASIHNAIVAKFGEACIDIDHDTVKHAAAGEVAISNSIFACTTIFLEEGDEFLAEGDTEPYLAATEVFAAGGGNTTAAASAVLSDVTSINAALTGGVVPADPFFDQVSYIGGITAADNWLEGWTTGAQN
ncbi:MAG: hypothetical protein JXX14_08600 [Deltaproteobacteria bacterium]|nr:hypothetical protein [Deltaproteobacteria bacterium]